MSDFPERERLPLPPEATRIKGEWQFGRYRAPFVAPTLHTGALKRFRLKEWHYLSFVTDEWFLAFGVVQLGYLANAFAYLVDRSRPRTPPREFEAMSPLGAALGFAPSSINGTTRWNHGQANIAIAWDGAANGWHISLEIPFEDATLTGELSVNAAESLALLHPLDPKRPAYTHKAAGLRAGGVVKLGEKQLDFRHGIAVVDWTRSIADRETKWNWASMVGQSVAGKTIGLNLSAHIYDDDDGDSRENGLWIDGKVTPLGGVHFDLPRDPGVHDWRITTRVPEDEEPAAQPEVDLTFEPFGARRQSVDYRLIKSEFIQPFGVFNGRIREHEIKDCFGVVEDHLAVW